MERVDGEADKNSLTLAFNMVVAKEIKAFCGHLSKISHTRPANELSVAKEM